MATELAQVARFRDPPGPRGLPYFGCLNGLLRNPMLFWSSIATRYGGIARVPLMKGHVAYLVSDPALLYELLITNRHKYAYGRVGEIDVPTLVIWGDLDFPQIARHCEHLVATIRGARAHRLANAAHLPNLEDGPGFNETLIAFLRSV